MKVYLAGPIYGQTDEQCRSWRDDLKEAYPEFSWVDPMDWDYRGREGIAAEEIVRRDKQAILGCDALFANITIPSVGTTMEVMFAWANGLHVVLANNTYKPLSPWLLMHSHTVVSGGIRGGVEHGLKVFARKGRTINEVSSGHQPQANVGEVHQIQVGGGATANAAD